MRCAGGNGSRRGGRGQGRRLRSRAALGSDLGGGGGRPRRLARNRARDRREGGPRPGGGNGRPSFAAARRHRTGDPLLLLRGGARGWSPPSRPAGHDPARITRDPGRPGARPHLDLALANRDQLVEAGLPPPGVFDAALCTRCHPAFHSTAATAHRSAATGRSRSRRGRRTAPARRRPRRRRRPASRRAGPRGADQFAGPPVPRVAPRASARERSGPASSRGASGSRLSGAAGPCASRRAFRSASKTTSSRVIRSPRSATSPRIVLISSGESRTPSVFPPGDPRSPRGLPPGDSRSPPGIPAGVRPGDPRSPGGAPAGNPPGGHQSPAAGRPTETASSSEPQHRDPEAHEVPPPRRRRDHPLGDPFDHLASVGRGGRCDNRPGGGRSSGRRRRTRNPYHTCLVPLSHMPENAYHT